MGNIAKLVDSAGNSALSAETRRKHAVAAALEVISSRAAAGEVGLVNEMNNLSKYADQIQEALKKAE